MALFGRKKYTLVNVKKKDIPAGLWAKCPDCATPTYQKELANNLYVCPKCGAHLPLPARARIELLMDEKTFGEMDENLVSVDPLNFKGPKTYRQKLDADQKMTGLKDLTFTAYRESIKS